MIPGYYLNESRNLLIIYPKSFFYDNLTTFEVYDKNKKEFVRIHFPDQTVQMFDKIVDTEFLGDL
jgi:hypothetical protein